MNKPTNQPKEENKEEFHKIGFIKIPKGGLGMAMGFIAAALMLVAGDFAKDWAIEKIKSDEWSIPALIQDVSVSKRITGLSVELRAKTDANRVAIYLFHNGAVYSNGVPFKKSSLIYEILDNTTVPISQSYQGLPLTQMAETLNLLIKNEHSFFVKTSDMTESPWKFMLLDNGIKSCYYKRIMDDQKLVGYIAVTFDQNLEPDQHFVNLVDYYTGVIASFLKREGRF